MLNLNKVIYGLLILLLLEISLVFIYFFIETLTKKESPKVQSVTTERLSLDIHKKPNIEVSKIVVKKSSPVVKNKPKFQPTLKPKPQPIISKSLEEILVRVSPKSTLDIVAINNQKVKPIIYTKSIKLSALSIADKKKMFIDMLIPSILVAKHRIVKERKRVAKLLRLETVSSEDALWLTKKRYIFKASNIDELYDKMELHPTSIVIAQAIIESGWGTSRFFEKANNVFGIWSFNEYEKRIAASKKRGNHTVYLKKYASVEQSIHDYFIMLSTKDAYKDFRATRLESQDPFVLIKELGKYSELGDEYIENLRNTITTNKLLAYDSYSLDI